MKIIIANGTHEADYLVSLFKKEKFDIVVINNDPIWAKYISEKNEISVFRGDPTKKFVQEEARVQGADFFVALSSNDIDNYICCQIAKKIFGVKKVVSIVQNPKYVDVFDRLGIEGVVSSTNLLASKIFSEASFDKISTVLSLENDKLIISDVLLKENSYLVGKLLKDVNFPIEGNICAIYRDPEVIIPYGGTKFESGDKLLIVCSQKYLRTVLDFINKEIK